MPTWSKTYTEFPETFFQGPPVPVFEVEVEVEWDAGDCTLPPGTLPRQEPEVTAISWCVKTDERIHGTLAEFCETIGYTEAEVWEVFQNTWADEREKHDEYLIDRR